MQKSRNVIEIKDIREAKPIKATWYKYYDDIFVSVIPTIKKSHIRRKSSIPDNKQDNKMCHWHTQWQYARFESEHGVHKTGNKTYEQRIEIDGEVHIIDTVVEKVAIEFQHSLGVSLEEMDSRYNAHKKAGFTPYLVIDFSDIQYKDFVSALLQDSSESSIYKIERKLEKWMKCTYFLKNSLFVDLESCIVRLSKGVFQDHLQYNRKEFTVDISLLDSTLQQEIEKESIRIRLENQRRRELEEQQRKKAEERERSFNIEEKQSSQSYDYFRRCLQNPVISKFLDNFEDEFIKYYSTSDEEDGCYLKRHEYYSQDSDRSLIYETVSAIRERAIKTRRGIWNKKEFKYLYANVIYSEGKPRITRQFKIEFGKTKQVYSSDEPTIF